MTVQRIQSGQIGEEAVVCLLERQGCQILERNFRNRLGEIDIIARDGETICFVEVKTRKTKSFGSPFESVTPAKQRKIIQVALSYLKFKRQEGAAARFDVAAVLLDGEQCADVEILKDAFEVM